MGVICDMANREEVAILRQASFEGECAFFMSSEWVQQTGWLGTSSGLSKAKGIAKGTWLKSKQKAALSCKVMSTDVEHIFS